MNETLQKYDESAETTSGLYQTINNVLSGSGVMFSTDPHSERGRSMFFQYMFTGRQEMEMEFIVISPNTHMPRIGIRVGVMGVSVRPVETCYYSKPIPFETFGNKEFLADIKKMYSGIKDSADFSEKIEAFLEKYGIEETVAVAQ